MASLDLKASWDLQKLAKKMTRKSAEKEEEEEGEKEGAVFPIWDCGSPLYDSYELVSLTHLIERHMMALPSLALGGSKQINTEFCDLQNVSSSGRVKGSSMVNSFSEFLVKRMWKWKRKRKERPRKMKTGFSGFCDRIGLRKK